MICDYLRSCYTTHARLHAGDPDRLTKIRWYWAPEGAKVLPHRSAVMSLNWESRNHAIEAPDIGEMPGFFRTWSNGRPPTSPAVDGQHYCGPAAWYLTGTPAGGHYPRGDDGPLLACTLPGPTPVVIVGPPQVQIVDPGAFCDGFGPTAPSGFAVEMIADPNEPPGSPDFFGEWFAEKMVTTPHAASYRVSKAADLGGRYVTSIGLNCAGGQWTMQMEDTFMGTHPDHPGFWWCFADGVEYWPNYPDPDGKFTWIEPGAQALVPDNFFTWP